MNNAIRFGLTSITGAKQIFLPAFNTFKTQVPKAMAENMNERIENRELDVANKKIESQVLKGMSEKIKIIEEGDKVTLNLSGGFMVESTLSGILLGSMGESQIQGKLDIVSDIIPDIQIKNYFSDYLA